MQRFQRPLVARKFGCTFYRFCHVGDQLHGGKNLVLSICPKLLLLPVLSQVDSFAQGGSAPDTGFYGTAPAVAILAASTLAENWIYFLDLIPKRILCYTYQVFLFERFLLRIKIWKKTHLSKNSSKTTQRLEMLQ